jgi:GntR family transcriptional regulator, transcriptional repressor for pyruvate dehydrogenase complex
VSSLSTNTDGVADGFPIATSGSILRPLKTAEVVARDVIRDIGRFGLRPGDNLESESAMLERYNVSRESLREGLRLLEVQGLIAIRRGPGGGPIVGKVDPTNLGRVESLFFNLAGATYDELFEAWVLAETTLAERAAAIPDKARRASALAPYLSGGLHIAGEVEMGLFVEGHGGFHNAVAELGGNRVLHLSFRAFGQIVAHHVATIADPRSIGAALEEDHVHVAELIVAGRVRAAGAAMREHLEDVVAVTKERFGDDLGARIEWL